MECARTHAGTPRPPAQHRRSKRSRRVAASRDGGARRAVGLESARPRDRDCRGAGLRASTRRARVDRNGLGRVGRTNPRRASRPIRRGIHPQRAARPRLQAAGRGESARCRHARHALAQHGCRDRRVLVVVTHNGVLRAPLALATDWDMSGKPPIRLQPATPTASHSRADRCSPPSSATCRWRQRRRLGPANRR